MSLEENPNQPQKPNVFRNILKFLLMPMQYLWTFLMKIVGDLSEKFNNAYHYFSRNSFFSVFCENTNVHGFNHVANSNHNPIER